MDWINNYNVQQTNGGVIITGRFNNSNGEFKIVTEGDGGNADTCEVILSGGQFYDGGTNDPIVLTILGAWEIREIIEMFALLGSIIDKK